MESLDCQLKESFSRCLCDATHELVTKGLLSTNLMMIHVQHDFSRLLLSEREIFEIILLSSIVLNCV